MKQLCITYHMTRPGEVAETCTTISVTDTIAEDILTLQDQSIFVRAYRRKPSIIMDTLELLADLQGYHAATFCCAEEVTKP